MKKDTFLFIAVLLTFMPSQSQANEMTTASIPDVNLTPSLQSVLRQKDSILQETQDATEQKVSVSTNGYVLENGNIIVDNLAEPKCVFYGNYNAGSSDAFQYIDIDTLVLNCQ